jgi:hypothetical protein
VATVFCRRDAINQRLCTGAGSGVLLPGFGYATFQPPVLYRGVFIFAFEMKKKTRNPFDAPPKKGKKKKPAGGLKAYLAAKALTITDTTPF